MNVVSILRESLPESVLKKNLEIRPIASANIPCIEPLSREEEPYEESGDILLQPSDIESLKDEVNAMNSTEQVNTDPVLAHASETIFSVSYRTEQANYVSYWPNKKQFQCSCPAWYQFRMPCVHIIAVWIQRQETSLHYLSWATVYQKPLTISTLPTGQIQSFFSNGNTDFIALKIYEEPNPSTSSGWIFGKSSRILNVHSDMVPIAENSVSENSVDDDNMALNLSLSLDQLIRYQAAMTGSINSYIDQVRALNLRKAQMLANVIATHLSCAEKSISSDFTRISVMDEGELGLNEKAASMKILKERAIRVREVSLRRTKKALLANGIKIPAILSGSEKGKAARKNTNTMSQVKRSRKGFLDDSAGKLTK